MTNEIKELSETPYVEPGTPEYKRVSNMNLSEQYGFDSPSYVGESPPYVDESPPYVVGESPPYVVIEVHLTLLVSPHKIKMI